MCLLYSRQKAAPDTFVRLRMSGFLLATLPEVGMVALHARSRTPPLDLKRSPGYARGGTVARPFHLRAGWKPAHPLSAIPGWLGCKADTPARQDGYDTYNKGPLPIALTTFADLGSGFLSAVYSAGVH